MMRHKHALRGGALWLAAAVAAWAQTPESIGKAYRESPTPARRKALERFASAHKDVNGALAHLTLGISSFGQKQFPDAIAHLEAARARLPKLADYTAYYLAAARLEMQDNAAAAHDAASVRAAPLASPLAAKAMVLEARGLTGSGSAANAVQLLHERYGELPQPDGDLALAAAYEGARDPARAAQYYQRVYYDYPGGDPATNAAAGLMALRDAMGPAYPQPGPPLLLERARKLLAQRDYYRARAEFQSLVEQLTGPERDRARVGIGAVDFLNGDVAAAYSYLHSLDLKDPDADAERLFYVAESARKLNDDDQMMEAVQKLGKHHAESLWRCRALTVAANRFLVANQPDKSTPLYQAACENFPDQPQAAAWHWRVTWAAYVQRKREARDLLREHLRRYADHPSASAALYFLGRLAETDGDPAAARAYYSKLVSQFPSYYYGFMARDRLKLAAIAAAASSPAALEFLRSVHFEPRKPAIDTRPDAESSLRIARARLLVSAGLSGLAQAELRFGVRRGNQPYLLAMELARIAPTPHDRLHAMKSAAPEYLSLSMEDAPATFWQLLFPLPYESELLRSARAQDLDPYMIAALIRQESEFNPQALSARHAYGLTQVEPATGRALARRAGVRHFTNRSLFIPSINLRLGTFYLRGLLNQWNGRWEQALASYNAGKSHVNDWITWHQYQEPAEFVESIPFTETREYVEAVLRNAAVYRELYGNKRAFNSISRVRTSRRAPPRRN